MSFGEFRQHYNDQPHEVSIETQALCNARCTFCPYPTLDRKGVKMPDELLDRLVTEMAEFKLPFYFSPFKVNEPLLDKRLIPLCEKVNQTSPRAVLRIFSNGSALTDSNIDAIAKLRNVAHLWISLNHHDAAEYERIMGLKFSHTAARLDALHGREFPHPVAVSRVGGDVDFVYYVRERWPKFKPVIIKKDAWIDYTDADDPSVPDAPCYRWWELSITAEGKAVTCCMTDGDKDEWVIGDTRKNSLLEIYNSPFWKERRDRLLSRKSLDERSPCSRCSY